jgi:hypothetical protein
MTDPSEYLNATDETGAVAAADLMDRLTERLKAADGSAAKLKERRAAAEAIAEIAADADRPAAVVNEAINNAGMVAQRSNTKKDQITDAIRSATESVRLEQSKAQIGLERGYGLDEYLERNLVQVKKWQSTDHHADPRFEWEFDDGAVVETGSGTAFGWYEFWVKLADATDEYQLLPEFASEEIGNPEEDPRYAELSLGPESRPWSESKYIQCITDLKRERVNHVETVGPRTEVWEAVRNHIARSRAVTDLKQAIDHKAVHVTYEDGDLTEVWVPTTVINTEAEEHGIETDGLHSEVVARGADSDELGGERIAEAKRAGTTTLRFWRLDATHGEVPEPDEIVDELTTSTDSLDSIEWGDADE